MSESDALSNCATGAYINIFFKQLVEYTNIFPLCKAVLEKIFLKKIVKKIDKSLILV